MQRSQLWVSSAATGVQLFKSGIKQSGQHATPKSTAGMKSDRDPLPSPLSSWPSAACLLAAHLAVDDFMYHGVERVGVPAEPHVKVLHGGAQRAGPSGLSSPVN